MVPKKATKEIGTVQGASLISRLAYIRGQQIDIDVETLLDRSGLTRGDVTNQDARISVSKQIKFVELVAEAIDDDNFGFHLAQGFDLREIGLLYYVVASADTVGEALERAARCSVIINEGIVLTIQRKKRLRVVFKHQGIARYTDRHQIEFWVTTLIRIVRQLTSRQIYPDRVSLMHHKIDEQGEFQKFIGGKLQVDAHIDGVDFTASVWNLRVVNADPYLHRLLLNLGKQAHVDPSTPASSLKVKVENVIVELLPHGNANLARVAARLGFSASSLARRLSAENLNFAAIRLNLKTSLADRYLADSSMRISQIAWLLGYKSNSAFTHAFVRWTGQSPRLQRQRLERRRRIALPSKLRSTLLGH